MPTDKVLIERGPNGNQVVRNDAPLDLTSGQQFLEVNRFRTAGRNISRINEELRLLVAKYGDDQVHWLSAMEWVLIRNWPLPEGWSRPTTNLVIFLPDNYGFGASLRDCVIDPGPSKSSPRLIGGISACMLRHGMRAIPFSPTWSCFSSIWEIPTTTGMRIWLMPEWFPAMNFLFRKLMKPGIKPQPAILVCTEAFWSSLRQHLLKPDGKERVAFSLLGRSESRGRVAYYGYRLLPIPDERCVEQHPYLVEPDPVAVVDCFDAYHQSFTVAFMHAHSHPFCDVASFSGTDDAYLPGTVQSLQEYLEATKSHRPCRFLRMVTGQNEGGFRIV